MDDFPGNATTNGIYNIASSPLAIKSDFAFDTDWIKINRFKQHYSYEILTYSGNSATGHTRSIYSLDSNPVFENQWHLPSTITYQHNQATGEYFLAFETSPRFANVDAAFNLFIRGVDEAPDEIGHTVRSLPLRDGKASGALGKFGDVDIYAQNLFAGRRYVFDLLGAASFGQHNTLLTDPILRIFGSDGKFLVGDNNSGTRTNARLVFTPTTTDRYYLKILGANNTAGSYLIQSNQTDDFPASAATTGRIVPDGSAVTVTNDFDRDEDWLRVRLEKGTLYSFTGAASYSLINVLDHNGNMIPFVPRKPFEHIPKFRPDKTQDYFVAVRPHGFLDEIKVTSDPFSRGDFPFPAVDGTIGNDGFDDIWDLDLISNASYFVHVVPQGANPLQNAVVTFASQTNSQSAVFDFETRGLFHNKTQRVVLLPTETKPFTVTVSSSNNTSGGYQLRITQVDIAAGDRSTQSRATFEPVYNRSSVASITHAIDNPSDVDFHRVSLVAEQWYRFNGWGTESYRVSSPSNQSITANAIGGAPVFIYATETGDHFVEVASDDLKGDTEVGGYQIQIEANARPLALNGHFSWPDPGFTDHTETQTKTINFVTKYVAGGSVEVFSKIELEFNGGMIPANELTVISRQQWDSTVPAGDFRGNTDVFSRYVSPEGGKTDWSHINVTGHPFPESMAPDQMAPNRVYEFPETLPDYFQNDTRFSGFQPLNETERVRFDGAFRVWSANSRHTGHILPKRSSFQGEAEVKVFKAALNTDDTFLAFPHGDGEGGDIILNTNSPVMQDLTPRTEGYFEVLRAAGISLGLKETTEFGRHETVMGLRSGEGIDDFPYASTPLPLDYRAVNDREDQGASGYGPTLPVGEFSGPYIIIGDPWAGSGTKSISAIGSGLPWVLDLRRGASSYAVTGNGDQPSTVLNSFVQTFQDAWGSDHDDMIIGNQLSNRIYGLDGNDTMIAGTGTYSMRGGHGDDLYIVKLGSSKVLNDQTANRTDGTAEGSGLDTLRIEGMYDLNLLEEDLTFQRSGSNSVSALDIRLELDGEDNFTAQRIRIENMDSLTNRLERLTIANQEGDVVTISLISAYDQATFEKQRFQLAAGSDGFGRLVTPI